MGGLFFLIFLLMCILLGREITFSNLIVGLLYYYFEIVNYVK